MSDALKDLQALSDKISGNHDGKVFGGVNAYLMCVEPLGNVAAYIEHLEDKLDDARIAARQTAPVTSLTALREEVRAWAFRWAYSLLPDAKADIYRIVGIDRSEPSTFTSPSVINGAEAEALLLAGLPKVPK